MFFKKCLKYLKEPKLIILNLMDKNVFKFLPDKLYLKWKYKLKIGKKLSLSNPKSFNEKLQWLKINNKNLEYTKMVDKNEVKEYISNIIPNCNIIKTLDVVDSFEKINFDKLPQQFVIKLTHDSGGIVVCKDKSSLDIKNARKIINKYLKRKYYYIQREWPYKNVKPRILVETFLSNGNKDLEDYKIHCFNGKAKIILVCKDRFSENGLTEDFFDENWNHLDIKRPDHGNCLQEIQKPKCLSQMIEYAEKISKDIPFLRVDFYEVENKIFFGEITFYPGAGFGKFVPEEWDYKLGEMIKLPIDKQ